MSEPENVPTLVVAKMGHAKWLSSTTNQFGGGSTTGPFRTAQGAFEAARRVDWTMFAGERTTVHVRIEAWSAEMESYAVVSEYDLPISAVDGHDVGRNGKLKTTCAKVPVMMDPIALRVAARFAAEITLKKIPDYAKSQRWVVVRGDQEIGIIEKMRSSKTTLNPYKAYVGVGAGTKFLDSYYDEAEARKFGVDPAKPSPGEGPMLVGGKDAAMKAVAHHAFPPTKK